MLGDHIRKRRLDLGLYQNDLAKHLGVDVETIWRWERNESRPMVYHIPGIIRFLGYNPFPEPESLRERLILRRKLLGLSQEGMATRLGVDETTVWYFEKGNRRPSTKMKQAVEDFLRTSVSEDGDPLWNGSVPPGKRL